MSKKVSRQGGRRPGAGRPVTDTVEIRTYVKRDTLAKIERTARKLGLQKTRGGGTPFLGSALDHILAGVETQEPEYVRIAREAREEQERRKEARRNQP